MRRTNKPKKVLDKKLKQKYVTKIETGLYLYERGEEKLLIQRNDRCNDWDIYETTSKSGLGEFRHWLEPHPDNYCSNAKTLREAIHVSYLSSLRASNRENRRTK